MNPNDVMTLSIILLITFFIALENNVYLNPQDTKTKPNNVEIGRSIIMKLNMKIKST